MSMQDSISDLFTRIRNGYSSKKNCVNIYYSNFKYSILKVMFDENFIDRYEVVESFGKKNIYIYLKYYGKKNTPVLKKIKRVSRPGLRVYKKHNELLEMLNGVGIALVSTSIGVLTSINARKLKHGGEVLCILE